MVSQIYPSKLQLNKANASDTKAAFLDLHLSISNNIVSTKLYDKRDDFDFGIVNFPCLGGDVPRSTSYGVYISQLIRFARASSYVADFNTRNKLLTQKLLKRGYRYHKLRKTFSKFYRRYYDLISKFQVGLKSLLRQGLSEPDFYGDLVYKLRKVVGSNNLTIGNDLFIICGDFNLTLNPDLDCFNYKHINNPKARDFLSNVIEENNLFDTFRELHPSQRRYTWRRKNPLKQSRLDFFLVTENIVNLIKKSKIETGYKSDHSIVTLILAMDNFVHGKSLWKHNNSLLTDAEYLKTINSKIQEIKKQYCLPVYNHDAIDEIPDEELQLVINDQLFLETIMMEIRGKSISYASYKKKLKNIHEQKLIKEIQGLEDNLTENNIPSLEKLKLELCKLREEIWKDF